MLLYHSPITNRTILCIFGAFLTLFFSYGIINFTFDLIHISSTAAVRKAICLYSFVVFIFTVILIEMDIYFTGVTKSDSFFYTS